MPKNARIMIRVSDDEERVINNYVNATNYNKTTVIRQAIAFYSVIIDPGITFRDILKSSVQKYIIDAIKVYNILSLIKPIPIIIEENYEKMKLAYPLYKVYVPKKRWKPEIFEDERLFPKSTRHEKVY